MKKRAIEAAAKIADMKRAATKKVKKPGLWSLFKLHIPKGWHGVQKDYTSLKVKSVEPVDSKRIEQIGGIVFHDLDEALLSSFKFNFPVNKKESVLPHAELSGSFKPFGEEEIFIPKK